MSASYCNFHLNHAITPEGLHWYYPYCGCGWIGGATLTQSMPGEKELESAARWWEQHRRSFAARQTQMRKFAP